ncbi:MAG: GGDEF domain-containing protein [Calditerrivibrio sp.]|nr:GGDEF domain-containing protein [Calditerrivibrio sp.]
MTDLKVYHNITDKQLTTFLEHICSSLYYETLNEITDLENSFVILHLKDSSEIDETTLLHLLSKNTVMIISDVYMLDYFYKLSREARFLLALNGIDNKTLLEINVKAFISFVYKMYEMENQNRELEEKIFDLAFATTDVLEQKEKMEDMVSKDGMTKLFNHSFFKDILNKEFQKAKLENGSFVIAIMDLDYFKNVNDHYGHLKGDEVLRAFAQCINNHIDNKQDIPARYGGEEFAVIFRNQTVEEALIKIQKIRNCLDSTVFTYENSCFKVTFSAGITPFSPALTDTTQMIKIADDALYQSKRDGRNRNTVKTI